MNIAQRRITIGLLWHSCASGNLGVVALTLAQLEIVRVAAREAGVSVQFKIFGWEIDRALQQAVDLSNLEYFELNAREIINPGSAFRKAIRKCDLVLDVGEGDSFSDIYGLKRLLYLALSKCIAGSGGRTLVMSPQTIGPFSTIAGRVLARVGLAFSDKVFARDPMSKAWLDSHGLAFKSQEAIDMAFRLPFEKQEGRSANLRIGLNISGLLYSGGYGGNNSLNLKLDFVELSHRIVQWALQLPGCEVWLVSHVYSKAIPEEDDSTTADILVARYPKLRKAPVFETPVAAKTFMSGLDFFAGARMHACIGAFSAGVPTVPLAYSRKFNGLFSSIAYPVLVDCLAQTNDEAFAIVCSAFKNRHTLAGQVAQGNRLALSKLQPYEAFIAGTLTAMASKV